MEAVCAKGEVQQPTQHGGGHWLKVGPWASLADERAGKRATAARPGHRPGIWGEGTSCMHATCVCVCVCAVVLGSDLFYGIHPCWARYRAWRVPVEDRIESPVCMHAP
jgi:hypothetical protein